ncbi:MAG TPA: sulfotransferase [Xanthomonadales bacterium]|nr:sulfotransferase [Xanthomonadales bacterium]
MSQETIAQTLEHAFQLLNQGHRDQAESICRRVLAQYPKQSDALNLMGQIEMSRRQFEKARQLFKAGLKIAPANLQMLNNAGWVEKELKNYDQSEAFFVKALKLDPGYYYARQNLAVLYQDQRKFSAAKRLYREVIRQQPNLADALANLSSILEKEHELDAAGSLARQALNIDPGHYVARLALANIAAQERAFDQVIGLLGPLLKSRRLPPMDWAVAGAKCAHAYDRQGHYKPAFALFEAANEVLFRQYEQAMGMADLIYSPAAFDCIQKTLPEFSFRRESRDAAAPVFLIGFPRSGTTLLDQVLSSHSQITVLEEKPTLEGAFRQFPATGQGLGALQRAGEGELEKLRRSYWARVKQEMASNRLPPVVVDKLPLNAFALLHINRMFPNARIIVSLRDPRDCVFSSFQHTFRINSATFQLLKLETAVSFYDQVMSVIAGVHDAQALAMHFVRYENVVDDFETEVRALIEFLGLDWEHALFDYQLTAKSRDIRTPSSSQVIQPLYTSSIGKWRHYQEWIGTRFEPLDKWVEKWGYSPI